MKNLFVITLFLAFVLSACSGAKTTVAEVQATQVPPSPTPTSLPFADLKEWDLLIVSDSSNWGVGQYYAKLIEADMNVKVNLHDCWVGGLPILQTLQSLQSGGRWSSYIGDKSCQKPLIDLVKEAEVMVLFGNGLGADYPMGFDDCVKGDYIFQFQYYLPDYAAYKNKLLASCNQDGWSTYKTNLGLVIDEIYKIREGRPIILRMTDFYNPAHSKFLTYNIDDVCTACLASFAEAIREVAAEHGVPVADTMLGFNGKDYMADPVEAGYIRSDGEHPSDTGAQFIAKLLQQTGYTFAGK